MTDAKQVNQRANHSGRCQLCQHRGYFEIIVTGHLLGYEPSIFARDKLAYVSLNIPTPCPPRGAFPRSTGGASVASFINDAPGPN